MRAERNPDQRERLLATAYLVTAERYSQRGEEWLHLHWLHRAAELRPKDAELLLRVADAEWAARHQAVAGRLYRRVLELSPRHADRRRILVRLAELQGMAQ
jgi:predicted TPR repeat methyltransferase